MKFEVTQTDDGWLVEAWMVNDGYVYREFTNSSDMMDFVGRLVLLHNLKESTLSM